ncbi:hypothetical protein CJD36_019920 [Flavipsychrobacter stenotrophus]|uniref:DUF1320 domain-containing protein n=1 Tax=Flavipsychrobacter stenotrophus TaxID=2077091 RepID=A0A2S7SS37_9BACT|nr:phage protein Gp36 family protein [Flavipsychrobacter stenotrophus]PQJ09564.1 hypothetical protein CJD36_019920 [Flavipsychrobacter stenotrophus]
MPYTPIIVPADLSTHVYAPIINEIAENNNDTIVSAISMAIDEAKMYLTRYDLIAIFGDPGTNVAATFTPDAMLLNIIKTIAVWNLMNLANPNLDYEQWQNRYKQMISSLKDIQKGLADPRWPYQDYTDTTTPDSIEVYAVSNEKANNSY